MFNTYPSNPWPLSTEQKGSGGGGESSSGINYSTEEKEIGTWVDGKTLYEKTYILRENGTDKYPFSTNMYDIGLTGVDFVVIKGFCADRAREAYIDSLPISNEVYLSFKKDTGALYIVDTHSPENIYVTLQYTKTESEE